MAAQLDHTIVHAHRKEASARFLTEILDLPEAKPSGHFLVVELDNGVSLDFCNSDDGIATQHYAFLVSDADFEGIFERIRSRGLRYWADPGRTRPDEIYRHDGGRGLYFEDPSGHLLEALTRPYGSAGRPGGTSGIAT